MLQFNESRIKKYIMIIGVVTICVFLAIGCTEKKSAVKDTAESKQEENIMVGEGFDGTYEKEDGREVIYLAGGCFWGMEKLAAALPGVTDAVSGYANGTSETEPTYQLVCTGGTGFKETVRVVYNPKVISLQQILQAYFLVIDPAVFNRQGNDNGTQYQTGIYYNDQASEKVVERIVNTEMKKHQVFAVEHQPLVNFYDAETQHQDYLEKHPNGYCHIPQVEIDHVVKLIMSENDYTKIPKEELKRTLTKEQYDVTQNAATEHPFTGEYWDNHQVGIYVDITTGQPLFRSSDKYDSGCGWPSFTSPINEDMILYGNDNSHNMSRTEVRSRIGKAHLGHVFENDPESPTGTRYCINSAALKFIPKEDMKKEGYGAYLVLFE
ncbi:MAG: peptide-methionine (R)-S-oxide reductase MsrB [Anaerovoracaceae bacterium]